MPLNLDALVLGPCLATFGEAVTYTPYGQFPIALSAAGTPLLGVFESAPGELKYPDGFDASITKPMLGMRASDFPAGVRFAQGDLVTVRGLDWQIDDVNQDGEGHVRFILRRAS